MRRLIAVALGVALFTGGCSKVAQTGGTGAEQNSWTKPHVLVYSDAQDINTLNTHLSTNESVQWIGQLTGAWLIRWDEHNNPYPELATVVPTQANGGVSKDGLAITYHLRHGVKWSDGAPFTADDVVFTTHVILNPANDEAGVLGWNQITKIDEPDKYTVVYHLSKPYSPFVETFFSTAGANPSILPKHLLANYPNINHVPFNDKPVGIGPFVVARWDRQQQVVMKANPLYWRGRPKLNEIIYKIVPDRNTLLAQMQTHDVGMWMLFGGAYYAQLKTIPGVAVLRQPSYLWNHFDFNLTHPVFQDIAVREALRYAFPSDEIREKIGHGFGSLSDSPTSPTAPYFVKVPLTPYDLAKANAILDKAGWVRGTDGVRAKNGLRLDLLMMTNAGSQDTDNTIELIRQSWQQIGVKLEVQHTPTALFFAPAREGGIVYGSKFDVVTFAWQNDAIGDYSQIYACNAFPPVGQNVPRWCDKTADAAMHSLYGHYDQAARNKDVAIFVRKFVQDVPVIVELQREDAYAYNSDLKNFHPNNVSQFDNMMDVDI
ncbi:MAG TPA: peptide ABC transporter substrate-binding protein [Candidatus Baltobacteraceae bacterium]|nr:peptide ABC transporter substrate-binding protein [Candidatus Baltobacteraceae bacterium]